MTEFGCCIDQENAAYGPDFEGCPDEDGSGAGFVDCSTSVSLFCRIQSHVDKIVAKESTFTYLICKYVHPIQKHGCCPDGLKKARGPDFKGCENATPCKDASWGCCPDLVHPAHGPNQEGCCISSEFGCCPDNIKEATVSIFYDTEYHDPKYFNAISNIRI